MYVVLFLKLTYTEVYIHEHAKTILAESIDLIPGCYIKFFTLLLTGKKFINYIYDKGKILFLKEKYLFQQIFRVQTLNT